MQEIGKVWVVCEFCGVANLFSNQFCSNCNGVLRIELRIHDIDKEDSGEHIKRVLDKIKKAYSNENDEFDTLSEISEIIDNEDDESDTSQEIIVSDYDNSEDNQKEEYDMPLWIRKEQEINKQNLRDISYSSFPFALFIGIPAIIALIYVSLFILPNYVPFDSQYEVITTFNAAIIPLVTVILPLFFVLMLLLKLSKFL